MKRASAGSTFKFRRRDRIGATAAEQDEEFLAQCFVDTGDLELLGDPDDKRVIVLGRTGSGKSALLSELERRKTSVLPLEPENLALSYISNSTILQFFSSLGVNLDPFFKLLWRHVLTVEILKHRFSGDQASRTGRSLIDALKALVPGTSEQEKRAREGIDYLTKWGETFWEQTEYRVKEITRKVETELEAAAGGRVGTGLVGGEFSATAAGRLSDNEKHELIVRGQAVISQAQVQDLSKVLDVLGAVLKDRQQVYFITIDRLDENWVEEKLRYKLIMALILTAREFLQVENTKVLVALRRDLIERVFRLTRDSGFQEEKYSSLYLPLEWRKSELLGLLDRRINYLVRRRYSGADVGFRTYFQRKSTRLKSMTIYLRARRGPETLSLCSIRALMVRRVEQR